MSSAAHRAPRGGSLAPRALTLAVPAARQRETAKELCGAAAPPRRRRGSGSGFQQALPWSERRCRAHPSGRSRAPNAAGRVRAAQAKHSPFFLCLRCRCLELLAAAGTLPSRGRPARAEASVRLGLGPGRGRWAETRGGRQGWLHLPRSLPLRPFRAGPVHSRPGEASAAAPPASGARGPARRRRGSDSPVGGARRRVGGGCRRPRRPLPPGLRLPPAAPREGGAGEGLALAWGAGLGAGGAGPGEAPREGHRSRGGAQRGGCREPKKVAPRCRRERSPASAAAVSETRLLLRAPGARSWAAAAAASGSRAPLAGAGAGARSPPSALGPGGGRRAGAVGGGRALGSGVRASGWLRRRVPRALGSLSSCSDCVSVSCLCSWGGPRTWAALRAGAGPAPASVPAPTP